MKREDLVRMWLCKGGIPSGGPEVHMWKPGEGPSQAEIIEHEPECGYFVPAHMIEGDR